MTTRYWWIGAKTALVLATVPAMVLADATYENVTQPQEKTGPNSSQQSQREQARQGRAFRTDERFTRTVAQNCRYVGSLEGIVREIPGQPVKGDVLYSPELTLSGEVQCPGGYRQRVGVQRLAPGRLTSEELERGADALGRVTIEHGGRVCTINPNFKFRGGRLVTSDSFVESCRTMRGGGPGPECPPQGS